MLQVCSKFFPQMMLGRVQFCPSCKWKCSSILSAYFRCTTQTVFTGRNCKRKCYLCKVPSHHPSNTNTNTNTNCISWMNCNTGCYLCKVPLHHPSSLLLTRLITSPSWKEKKIKDMEEWNKYRSNKPSGRRKLTVEYLCNMYEGKIYLKFDFIFWAGWKCNNTPESMWSKHIQNV